MKSIKGTIEFEIQYDENGYNFKYDQSSLNDAAANIITMMGAKNDIDYINENMSKFHGADKKNARTQLSKLSVTKSTTEIIADKLFYLHLKENGGK